METRKIPLNTDVYCPMTGGSYGGNPECEHDYPPEPAIDKDDYACWICTKCGMKRCYDVWD